MSWSDKPYNEIPFCEPMMEKEEADAVWYQVMSGWIGPGERVEEFEAALAGYVKAKHVICTTSGTVALQLAARALFWGQEEPLPWVIAPAYGVASVGNAFWWADFQVLYADIDKGTGRMRPDEVERLVDEYSDMGCMVCFVDFSGGMGEDLTEIRGICDEYKAPLIEDACCAMGHWFMDYHAGNWGNAGVLSFSVPKVLTTGQGGAVVTNDDGVAEKVRDYINHGRHTGEGSGSNLRLTDIQAALGLSQLTRMGEILECKRLAHRGIRRKLGKYLFSTDSGTPLHNIVFSETPELLVERLKEYGVNAKRQYQCWDSMAVSSQRWYLTAVYLPFGLRMNEEDGEYIGEAVLRTGVELVQP